MAMNEYAPARCWNTTRGKTSTSKVSNIGVFRCEKCTPFQPLFQLHAAW